MGKKIKYSQPLSVIWEAYNKSNKNGKLSPKEFIWEWMTPQIKNPFLSDGTQVQTNILISEMFYADTQKEFLHLYFVDKSLRDFLKDLPIKDFDGLMLYILEKGIDIEGGCVTTLGQTLKTGIISRKSGQKIPKIANLQYYKSKANYGTKKKGISR